MFFSFFLPFHYPILSFYFYLYFKVFISPQATLTLEHLLCTDINSDPFRPGYNPELYNFTVAVLTENSSLSYVQQTIKTSKLFTFLKRCLFLIAFLFIVYRSLAKQTQNGSQNIDFQDTTNWSEISFKECILIFERQFLEIRLWKNSLIKINNGANSLQRIGIFKV